MSAHMPGCVWDEYRRCYTTMAEGCAAPEDHAKWRHPTWCAACGEPIIYREEKHRCPPESSSPGVASGARRAPRSPGGSR